MGRLSNYLNNAYINDIWVIGDKSRQNPYVGRKVRVTWLRPWGKHPAGFMVTGNLLKTFCVRGRTLIGEIKTDYGKVVSAPWSKHYIRVDVL